MWATAEVLPITPPAIIQRYSNNIRYFYRVALHRWVVANPKNSEFFWLMYFSRKVACMGRIIYQCFCIERSRSLLIWNDEKSIWSIWRIWSWSDLLLVKWNAAADRLTFYLAAKSTKLAAVFVKGSIEDEFINMKIPFRLPIMKTNSVKYKITQWVQSMGFYLWLFYLKRFTSKC